MVAEEQIGTQERNLWTSVNRFFVSFGVEVLAVEPQLFKLKRRFLSFDWEECGKKESQQTVPLFIFLCFSAFERLRA